MNLQRTGMEVVHTGAGSRSRRSSGGTYVAKPGRDAGAGKHLVIGHMAINGQVPRIFPSQADSIPLQAVSLFYPDAKRGERATKMLATNEGRFDCQ
jgi:hypothetical protein